MHYKTNITIIKYSNWYVASDTETNVASQGYTVKEALNNFKEALELYYS